MNDILNGAGQGLGWWGVESMGWKGNKPIKRFVDGRRFSMYFLLHIHQIYYCLLLACLILSFDLRINTKLEMLLAYQFFY